MAALMHLPRTRCPIPAPQNFGCSVVESQLVNEPASSHSTAGAFLRLIDALNLFFTVAFTVELLINALAHWLSNFLNLWSPFRARAS